MDDPQIALARIGETERAEGLVAWARDQGADLKVCGTCAYYTKMTKPGHRVCGRAMGPHSGRERSASDPACGAHRPPSARDAADPARPQGRLTEDELAMCRSMGISEAAFKASRKHIADRGDGVTT